MAGAFERLAQSVLRHLGQDAFLLVGVTSTPVRVNIERAVNMYGPYDDGAMPRDVATLPSSAGAKLRDQIQVGGDTYVLDGNVSDNGQLARFIVTKV